MEAFKAECAEIIRRHRDGEITRQECIAALDSATAALVPYLRPDKLQEVQAVMRENSAILAKIEGPRS
jgi:hypothetical protein